MQTEVKMLLLLIMLTAGASDFENLNTLPTLPEKVDDWCEPPLVILCKDAGPLSTQDVKDAYKKLGDNLISNVVIRYCPKTCIPIPNTIVIDGPKCFTKKFDKDDSYAALTLRQKLPGGSCIKASRIEFKKWDERIVAHEAAHSLGWLHCQMPGHLMYPIYEGGGWNLLGMKEEQ
jgi:hypothetical protein